MRMIIITPKRSIMAKWYQKGPIGVKIEQNEAK